MYKGAASSPFSAGGEGEILSFIGRETCPKHSNYIPVLGKIYLMTAVGGAAGGKGEDGGGAEGIFSSDGGEVVLKGGRAPPVLLPEPKAFSLC